MPKKKKSTAGNIVPENDLVLPQNIISIGESVLENKKIYIHQSVYKAIHKYTVDKTVNESGGILVGDVIEEFDKTHIIINGFVEAKKCEATPNTLKFTHDTWDSWYKEIDKKYNSKKILGWIHTHPGFGIFLSEYDKFIQNNFFKDPSQIAYVIDPIKGEEGFYTWINDNIEKCNGFYIFDKAGTKIDIFEKIKANISETDDKISESFRSSNYLLLAFLFCMIVFLSFNIFSLKRKVNQYEMNIQRYEQNCNSIKQEIQDQQKQIDSLNNSINDGSKTRTDTKQ